VPVSKIARVIVSCVLLTFVVFVPPMLSYFGKESTALLTLVCLLIALMALNVNFDQLEQISLGPLSAKLRAKIVPNWHDAKRLRVPFSRSWKQ
jgi:hypothetical protein